MRRAQHRQKRDTNTRESAELKKEVQTLKRQLARQHKEVGKLQWVGGRSEPEPETDKIKRETCPQCGSTDLGSFTTPGGKVIISCKGCKKWRENK